MALTRGKGWWRSWTVRLALGLILLTLNLVLLNLLAARRPLRWDWTAARVHTLAPGTVASLRALAEPVKLLLFMLPPGQGEESIYSELKEVLRRFAISSPRISFEEVKLDSDPTRVELLARQYGVGERDLSGGAVVVARGERARLVRAADTVRYRREGARRRIAAFLGEGVLLSAVLAVQRRAPLTVCFSQGHGEAGVGDFGERGYGALAAEVRRESYTVRPVEDDALLSGLSACSALVVGGPNRAFSPVELAAVERYLDRGGRLFVLLGPVLDRRGTRHRRIGLEPLLSGHGVTPGTRIVVDPLSVPGEQPLLTWATRAGYTDHPAVRPLRDRITTWPLTRELRLTAPSGRRPAASALVRASRAGWAEADLASLRGERPLIFDAKADARGPVVAAAARWKVADAGTGEARLVVWGSERGVLGRRMNRLTQRDFNRELFLASLAWLLDEKALSAVAVKRPEHLQLTLDQRQMRLLFLCCVVVLPLCPLTVGLWVFWRRRR